VRPGSSSYSNPAQLDLLRRTVSLPKLLRNAGGWRLPSMVAV